MFLHHKPNIRTCIRHKSYVNTSVPEKMNIVKKEQGNEVCNINDINDECMNICMSELLNYT